MVDNIIIACGGILPLLSAATSPTVSTIFPPSGHTRNCFYWYKPLFAPDFTALGTPVPSLLIP